MMLYLFTTQYLGSGMWYQQKTLDIYLYLSLFHLTHYRAINKYYYPGVQ